MINPFTLYKSYKAHQKRIKKAEDDLKDAADRLYANGMVRAQEKLDRLLAQQGWKKVVR